MNLHPIFVHFPIALFTLYALLEFLRFNKIQNQPYFFYLKAFLVMTAGLGALASYATGDQPAHIMRTTIKADPALRATLFWHENFAKLTVALIGLNAAAYFVAWLQREEFLRWPANSAWEKIWLWLVKIDNSVINSRWIVALAIAAFISVSVTGGLGGILAYGDKADPFFAYFYHLFIK
ncbi:MAG: hypothetical protein KGJ93_01350 [Patescibacteria group bacterium]|nr:hypothetical protein [Patescibacteria group bacterium]